MKSVLTISGGTAHWVYFQRRKVVGSFEESIAFDENVPYQPNCPVGLEINDVHLLIDCSRSEIDAYPLLPSGSAWGYRSSRCALQKKLVDQFPEAIIRNPDKKAHLDALFVQHLNLPNIVRNWLSYVECSEISFCSVTCISELLAKRWGTGSGCIILSVAAGFVRHTYCLSGHALFTRAVSYADTKEFVEQFNQTLSHLRASELIEHSVPVRTIGVSDALVCDLRSLEWVGEVKSVAVEDDSIPVWLAEQLQSSKTIRENNRYRQVSYLLNNYLQRGYRKARLQHNVMLGFLVVASMGFTASNEWQRIGDYEKYNARKVQLELAIKLYQTKSAELSPQATALSGVLFDKLAMESASGISPAILLTILAEVFSQYRALELQELEWAVVDLSVQSTEKVPSITKVTVSGTLSQSESLREQQNSFNEFIAYLEMQTELSNLVVLQTPLTQFERTSISRMDKPLFQVQFDFNRIVRNEV